MMHITIPRFGNTLKKFFLTLLQRLLITFELFNRNGLINHAAACAYGFLLSAAPALLFVSFVVSRSLAASPKIADAILNQIAALFSAFDVQGIINNFIASTDSGIAGLISIVSIFWTARLCALSAQRGLGVIFPGSRSALANNIVTIVLGLLTILFILIIILGLGGAMIVFNSSFFSSIKVFTPFLYLLTQGFFLFSLALLVLAIYRIVPANPPKVKIIIPGVLTCIILFLIFNKFFGMVINPARYDLLYGTLGRLFLFLVNIYFFFIFFFVGAQMIHMLGVSDALLFSRFRKVHSMSKQSKSILDKLFAIPSEPLKKYSAFYKEGEFVFTLHDQGDEVYYVVSGKAGVYLDKEGKRRIAYIEETHFFGEIASISLEGRAATIKAETDLSVMVLPPDLFRTIMQLDPETDKNLIKSLSQRLKSMDKQMQNIPTSGGE